jgi:hypothetical protein
VNGIVLSYGTSLDLSPFEPTPVGVIRIQDVSLGEAAIAKMLRAGIDDITVMAEAGAHLWSNIIQSMDENLGIRIMTPVNEGGPIGFINQLRLSNIWADDGVVVHPDNVVSSLDVSSLLKSWGKSDEIACMAVVVPGEQDHSRNGGVKCPVGYKLTNVFVVSAMGIALAMDTFGGTGYPIGIHDLYNICAAKGLLAFYMFDQSFYTVVNQTNLRRLLK